MHYSLLWLSIFSFLDSPHLLSLIPYAHKDMKSLYSEILGPEVIGPICTASTLSHSVGNIWTLRSLFLPLVCTISVNTILIATLSVDCCLIWSLEHLLAWVYLLNLALFWNRVSFRKIHTSLRGRFWLWVATLQRMHVTPYLLFFLLPSTLPCLEFCTHPTPQPWVPDSSVSSILGLSTLFRCLKEQPVPHR